MLRCPGELRELLMRLVDPAEADVDLDRLAELLRDDPAARRYYRQYMELHARLELMHDSPLPMPELDISLSACSSKTSKSREHPRDRARRGDPEPDARSTMRTRLRLWPHSELTKSVAVGALCALLGLILATWIVLRATNATRALTQVDEESSPGTAVSVERLGHVTRISNCAWRGDHLKIGAHLAPGAVVDLASGSMEIRMESGVHVVIEGPAMFRVETAGSGYLHQGRISCRVPEGVDGFTVLTPTARVIDFGTEFGVWVDGHGATEAHVFSGMVGFQPRSDESEDEVGDVHFISTAEGARMVPGRHAQVTAISYNSMGFPSLAPTEFSIVAHHSGGLLRSTRKGVLFGSALQTGTRRIGSSALPDLGLANVFLFRLPPLERPWHIESARLEWTHKNQDNTPQFSVDLYGLGYLRSAPREENWFYEGEVDSALRSNYGTGRDDLPVVLLQRAVLEPRTQPGRIVVDSEDLAQFIQSLYHSGAQGGELAVFRLNADTATNTITRKTGYTVVHAPAILGKSTPEELPMLHLRVLQRPERSGI